MRRGRKKGKERIEDDVFPFANVMPNVYRCDREGVRV